jgi:hypothetical protein
MIQQTTTIGIVDLTLYLEPMYGGDSIHEATITKGAKDDLLECGIPEYKSYQEVIDAYYQQTL